MGIIMRLLVNIFNQVLAYLSLCILSVNIMAQPPLQETYGMVHVKSVHSVKVTANRLVALLESKGLVVFNRIDHAAAARKVKKELRPTEVIIFGNPKIGTALMSCEPRIALDLPLKALIWQDKQGLVWFTYLDPYELAKRYKMKSCRNIIDRVSSAFNYFSNMATGN